jgi:hypothetical protein
VGKDGTSVAALSWQLLVELPQLFDGTRTELDEAANAAIAIEDMGDYQRTSRWPRLLVLPEAVRSAEPDGGMLLTHAYKAAANMTGDEQLLIRADGTVIFQRDTLWDVDRIAVDFGKLGHDTVSFLRFASRFAKTLDMAGELNVTLRVYTPNVSPPTVAHFSNLINASPVGRSGELSIHVTETRRRLPILQVDDKDAFAKTCKRILDGIANHFVIGRSAFDRGGPTYLAIEESSVRALCARML